MFDKAIAVGILILVGFCISALLKKIKVKITIIRLLFIWLIGAILAFSVGNGFLFYLGILFMGIATALFLFDLFIAKPQKAHENKIEELIKKAATRSIDEEEASILLKEATQHEAKGQIDDAKVLYELIVKSNTSFSEDAKSCLQAFKNKFN